MKENIIIAIYSKDIARIIQRKLFEISKYFFVTLITIDTIENKKKLSDSDINVVYYKLTNNKMKDQLNFNYYIKKQYVIYKPKLVVVYIFKMCFILPFLINRKLLILRFFHFDVSGSLMTKIIENLRKIITIFTYNIIEYGHDVMPKWILKIKKELYKIPGSFDKLSKTKKNFSKLKLLYIGTLTNRNIEITVDGFTNFVEENKIKEIEYHIIGSGDYYSKKKLLNAIDKSTIKNNIFYHGRLNDIEVLKYFDSCNIGVSFVPITKYFTNNTVTKTYEYLLSGMAVIATATNANKLVLGKSNGVLINDNSESFSKGLKEIFDKRTYYNSETITSSVSEFTHTNIVKNYTAPFYNKIIKKNECK